MQEQLSELVEELPADMQHVRNSIETSLANIAKKLEHSLENSESLTDEAQLKAHLGAMEAKEKMESSRKVFDEYLQRATEQGKTIMGELELKAHLAKMEAEDFWEKRGPELTEEFANSREAVAKLAGSAMDEMQSQFKKWNSIFNSKNKS